MYTNWIETEVNDSYHGTDHLKLDYSSNPSNSASPHLTLRLVSESFDWIDLDVKSARELIEVLQDYVDRTGE
jgi:hypothetical protein